MNYDRERAMYEQSCTEDMIRMRNPSKAIQRTVLTVKCPPCLGTGERVDNIIGPVGEVRVCTACGGTGIAR